MASPGLAGDSTEGRRSRLSEGHEGCVWRAVPCDPDRAPEGRLVERKEAADLGAGSRVEGTRALIPRCRQCG